VAKGYPDYYYPTLIERGISDVRGISPFGYTQFKLYYGYADGAILAEKPFHARYRKWYTAAPPETGVVYDKLTDEIFEISVRMDMVLLGLCTHSCSIEAYVSATNQEIRIKPYFIYRVNGEEKFRITCYEQVWDETSPTLKRHAGKYEITTPVYIYEGDTFDIRFGFKYYTTIAGSIGYLHLNFDLLKEDAFTQVPVKAIKPVE